MILFLPFICKVLKSKTGLYNTYLKWNKERLLNKFKSLIQIF